jgi:hypothetical protein
MKQKGQKIGELLFFVKTDKVLSNEVTLFIYLFLVVPGLELRVYTLSHSTSPCVLGIF